MWESAFRLSKLHNNGQSYELLRLSLSTRAWWRRAKSNWFGEGGFRLEPTTSRSSHVPAGRNDRAATSSRIELAWLPPPPPRRLLSEFSHCASVCNTRSPLTSSERIDRHESFASRNTAALSNEHLCQCCSYRSCASFCTTFCFKELQRPSPI